MLYPGIHNLYRSDTAFAILEVTKRCNKNKRTVYSVFFKDT